MPSYPGWSQLGVLVPARLCPVPLLPAELAGMLALPPRMSFSADPALVFLLLRILVPCLRDLVDPVGLLECALLGDVAGLLAQDISCNFLQRAYVRLHPHPFDQMGLDPVAQGV